MNSPDNSDLEEQRISILHEIDAGRSVTVHGEPEHLDRLRESLLEEQCSIYLADVVGEIVLIVDPSPGASGSDVVDVGDAPPSSG